MIVSETISATDSEENYLKNLVLYKKKNWTIFIDPWSSLHIIL